MPSENQSLTSRPQTKNAKKRRCGPHVRALRDDPAADAEARSDEVRKMRAWRNKARLADLKHGKALMAEAARVTAIKL